MEKIHKPKAQENVHIGKIPHEIPHHAVKWDEFTEINAIRFSHKAH